MDSLPQKIKLIESIEHVLTGLTRKERHQYTPVNKALNSNIPPIYIRRRGNPMRYYIYCYSNDSSYPRNAISFLRFSAPIRRTNTIQVTRTEGQLFLMSYERYKKILHYPLDTNK